jgi:pimeloyl-ACP methyl ester carboxylesterase
LGEVDITDVLANVRAPTLVMHATGDMRIPFNQGRALAAGIPGARFVSLNTNNHILPSSDPAWPVMLKEINDFLSSAP